MSHPDLTEFYFLRHAPAIKKDGHLPDLDAPITEHDHDIGPISIQLPDDADWHLSPLQRARQTAALLKPEPASTRMVIDNDLAEMSFGAWHGQPIAVVWPQIPATPRHNWSFIMPETTPPGGENFVSLHDRVSKWMRRQERLPARRPQIIVTHAGVMRAAMCHILGLDLVTGLGLDIPNLAILRARLMEPSRATDAGGPWQFVSLSRPESRR